MFKAVPFHAVQFAPAIRQLFGAIKDRWPFMRTMATLNWGASDNVDEEVGGVVDVWVQSSGGDPPPATEAYNETVVENWLASSDTHEYWNYWCCCYHIPSCLNNFVEWPAIHNRLFVWLSAYRNATGLLYYATNRWFGGGEKAHANASHTPIHRLSEFSARSDFDPNSYAEADGDGLYFYPGPDGPVTSIRYENLRAGLQDVELLHMAQATAGGDASLRAEIRKIIGSVITDVEEQFRREDPQVIEAARKQLADIIVRRRAPAMLHSDDP